MTAIFRQARTLLVILGSLLITKSGASVPADTNQQPGVRPKIQIALLLDVSNSMDGLINQAKDQLWNMVKVAGKATCDEGRPLIEIALYEYGRDDNDPEKGYIKLISPFTTNLDSLYTALYGLNTNGGKEFCTNVINTSLDELAWDTSQNSYKTIFIAGNEGFLQGKIALSLICNKAKGKGVIVNTIYCGDRHRGINENWALEMECTYGSFNNINQDAMIPNIRTPYDTTLIVMNKKFSSTFIYYKGYISGLHQYDTMARYDQAKIDKVIGYVVVRSDTNFYNRAGWELVDAVQKDSSILDSLDKSKLPDSLQNKSVSQLKLIVKKNSEERKQIRNEIKRLDRERDKYIHEERKKLNADLPKTLQTEIEKVIREQVMRFNMQIE